MNSLHCTRRLAACVFTLFVSFAALCAATSIVAASGVVSTGPGVARSSDED